MFAFLQPGTHFYNFRDGGSAAPRTAVWAGPRAPAEMEMRKWGSRGYRGTLLVSLGWAGEDQVENAGHIVLRVTFS